MSRSQTDVRVPSLPQLCQMLLVSLLTLRLVWPTSALGLYMEMREIHSPEHGLLYT